MQQAYRLLYECYDTMLYNITDEWEMFYLVGTIVLFLFQLVKHLDYLPVHIFQVHIFIQ